ncbi:MAG: 7-cyano-7-deazaguanine synthase QueC [Candidatus Brocadiae bacterium]|nr:7-cyano-7-deazaguanine synthase QueC [Candidatus Brocadiia bacterium]
MSKKKVVVLLSGGMDSVSALYESKCSYQIIAGVSFNYGAKHNDREIPYAVHHCQKLGIRHELIVIDFVSRLFKSDLLKSGGNIPDGHYEEKNMQQTVVPFRNGIMLSIAAGFAESIAAQGIVIGSHAGDHAIYPDCREGFMKSISEAIQLGTYAQIEVILPFMAMNKVKIVKRGQELGVDFSQTWSCYKGGNLHCGSCGTCVERREAFIMAGIKDPTAYERINTLPSKPTR